MSISTAPKGLLLKENSIARVGRHTKPAHIPFDVSKVKVQ